MDAPVDAPEDAPERPPKDAPEDEPEEPEVQIKGPIDTEEELEAEREKVADDFQPPDGPNALENCEDVCEGHDFVEAVCISKQGCEWDDDQCWSSVGPNPCDFTEPEEHEHENCELVCEGHNYSPDECAAIRGCEYDGGACWSAVGPHPCDSGPDPIPLPAEPKASWASNRPWGDSYGNKWGETYGPEEPEGVLDDVAGSLEDAGAAVTDGLEDAGAAVTDAIDAIPGGEAVTDGAEAAGEAIGDGAEAAEEAIGDGAEAAGEAISGGIESVENILPHFGDDEPSSEKKSARASRGKLGDGLDHVAQAEDLLAATEAEAAQAAAADAAAAKAAKKASKKNKGYVASAATKYTDGSMEDTGSGSAYPAVPTESNADTPSEPYVAASTKLTDGTFDGPDSYNADGVYPTGWTHKKTQEEIEQDTRRAEARVSNADAYKKAYAAADAEEEAVGDEHTAAADDDGYRGRSYTAASSRLVDGTEAAASLGDGLDHVEEAEKVLAEADADAEAEKEAKAAAKKSKKQSKKGYRSSYTINPYGVKDAEATPEADEETEDVPVEKPHGYVASSTKLTDGSASLGDISYEDIDTEVASVGNDWANYVAEPTNYHDAPANDEQAEEQRKSEAEQFVELEDKEEKEEAEKAMKAMQWTSYESENGKIDHALEAAEEAAAEEDAAASTSTTTASDEIETLDHQEEAEAVVAKAEEAEADSEAEKKTGYRAPATHLTDGSASPAERAPGAADPAKPHGYVAAATRLTDGRNAKKPIQEQPGYVAPSGYVAAGGRAEADELQKEAYTSEERAEDKEEEAPTGYIARPKRL